MSKLLGIQYLRAIAAIAVVVFHATSKEDVYFLVGEAGVDIFFILSGFLMIAITTRQTSPLQFATDRVRRILPAYWVATTVMLLGIVVGLFPNARIEPWHVIASYLFLPAHSPTNPAIWPLLIPGWTLNYEMAFYAIFALMLTIRNELFRLTVLSCLFITLVIVDYSIELTTVAGQFYTNQILLEFAAGGWLGYTWKYHRHWFRRGYALIIVGGLGFTWAWWQDTDAYRVALFGIPAFLVVAGVLAIENSKPIVPMKVPLLLGNASYSIYLWHTLAISVTSKISNYLEIPSTMAIGLNIAGGVGVGLVTYALIEEPLRALLSRKRIDAAYRTAV